MIKFRKLESIDELKQDMIVVVRDSTLLKVSCIDGNDIRLVSTQSGQDWLRLNKETTDFSGLEFHEVYTD